MARFDVYRGRHGVPYLLDVQSIFIDHLPTRVVVPLERLRERLPEIRDLTPTLQVGGEDVIMMTPLIASIPKRLLGRPVGNLESERDTITRALDRLLTGF